MSKDDDLYRQTNGSDAPTVQGSVDTPEFIAVLMDCVNAEGQAFIDARQKLIAHIDAALAQRAAVAEVASDDTKDCIRCLGSTVKGEIRGVHCSECNGRGYVNRTTPTASTPPAPAKGPADQWVWCGTGGRMPQHTRYLLIARKSGYTGVKYEFLTAQYDASYKGWTDPGNTRITESGDDPCWWFDGPIPTLPLEPIVAPPPIPAYDATDWKAKYEELAAKMQPVDSVLDNKPVRKFFGMGDPNNRE